MTLMYRATVILFFAVAGLVLLASLAAAQELTLKRVLLSSGGVGYFEHEASVNGDATLALDVPLGQVDDVLKSIVVFDDQGGAGTVRLPGREPLGQLFDELPITPDALGSTPELLAALKGASITVSGTRSLSGRLLAIEPETVALPNGLGTVTRHRVSLMTEAGIHQFLLEDQDTVRLADPALEAAVAAALDGFADNRARERRTLRIEARGTGQRTIRVGYVVSAPLWKTSYRLGLGAEGGSLQGWAHLENLSGQDWNGVELTLTSGNPVTFRQALYTAYFVDRPEVPVEVLGRVLPPPDEGALAMEHDEAAPRVSAAPRAEQESMKMAALDRVAGAYAATAPAPEPAPPPGMASGAVATAREDAATQIVLRIAEPITLASGQSLTVPVIDAAVPSETIALYQPGVQARHPLAAVRLANQTGTGLPPGVITVYERGPLGVAFAGDARLAPMPAGESRLLSFAVDQALTVDREDLSAQTLVGGKASRGSLQLSVRQVERSQYRIKSAATEPRRLVIEHMRLPGWDLVAGHADVELTESAYRVPVTVPPGATIETEIALEQTVSESYAIGELSTDSLVYYAEAGALDPALRAELKRLSELRGTIEGHRDTLKRLDEAKQRLFEDQARVRANLGEVPQGSDLHGRYLAKLGEQETELDRIAAEIATTGDAIAAAEAALAEAIGKLDVQ
ncbi:MAG: DUF4139 domain-containing protein [Alphaproteobacteria bacterium]